MLVYIHHWYKIVFNFLAKYFPLQIVTNKFSIRRIESKSWGEFHITQCFHFTIYLSGAPEAPRPIGPDQHHQDAGGEDTTAKNPRRARLQRRPQRTANGSRRLLLAGDRKASPGRHSSARG